MNDVPRRGSSLSLPRLLCSPEEQPYLEAKNGLRQFDEVLSLVDLAKGRLSLTPDLVCRIHLPSMEGILSTAGQFRCGPIQIHGTDHKPPDSREVPACVAEMCDYVSRAVADGKTPIHVAAYLMWRHNWIHPFDEGNGRTSRAISYYALCVMLNGKLPGVNTIPKQIVSARGPYYDALDAADAEWKSGKVDVSKMEELLEGMLAAQLVSAYHAATGKST